MKNTEKFINNDYNDILLLIKNLNIEINNVKEKLYLHKEIEIEGIKDKDIIQGITVNIKNILTDALYNIKYVNNRIK